jgi:RNA polymerase-binding transcription factor
MIRHDLRERLEARIRERYQLLAAEMHEEFLRSSNQDEIAIDQSVKDEGDQSVADTQAELNLQRMDQRGRELRALEQALSRMNDGTYGECEECGDAIDPRRLEVQPSSRWCIRCASKLEGPRST